ncbi:MAG: hypothetical protein IPJ66_09930 [Bacteroidetes bacterium]|nr:hypothetical protein [Bacteroidota bacterium]
MRSAGESRVFKLLAVVVFITILMSGCSPEKQFRILNFLFDGVPNPNRQTEVVVTVDSLNNVVEVVKVVKPEYFMHKPYEEDNCKSCHAEGFSNALLKPLPELCFTCHDNFNEKYKILHGPVGSGNCMSCHDQHMTKFSKLLTRDGQDVCFYCHSPVAIKKNKMHEKIEDKSCTTCHNPHGGENTGLLTGASCYSCHENFNSKFNHLHGPVAVESCTTCHDSHTSKQPKYLVKEGQQLCFSCHNSELVFDNPVHKKNKKANCTQCHNPHGGGDRFILVQSLMPLKTLEVEQPANVIHATDTIKELKDTVIVRQDTLQQNELLPAVEPDTLQKQ